MLDKIILECASGFHHLQNTRSPRTLKAYKLPSKLALSWISIAVPKVGGEGPSPSSELLFRFKPFPSPFECRCAAAATAAPAGIEDEADAPYAAVHLEVILMRLEKNSITPSPVTSQSPNLDRVPYRPPNENGSATATSKTAATNNRE